MNDLGTRGSCFYARSVGNVLDITFGLAPENSDLVTQLRTVQGRVPFHVWEDVSEPSKHMGLGKIHHREQGEGFMEHLGFPLAFEE